MIVSRGFTNVGRRVVNLFQCRECLVVREWNEELKSENRYLKSLLLEPREVVSDAPPAPFVSVKRPTWKETRTKLEKQSLMRKREDEKVVAE